MTEKIFWRRKQDSQGRTIVQLKRVEPIIETRRGWLLGLRGKLELDPREDPYSKMNSVWVSKSEWELRDVDGGSYKFRKK